MLGTYCDLGHPLTSYLYYGATPDAGNLDLPMAVNLIEDFVHSRLAACGNDIVDRMAREFIAQFSSDEQRMLHCVLRRALS